ncbi:MAG TPA: dethiobiotin synthase, partial [Sphingobacteriaceae bacterium]
MTTFFVTGIDTDSGKTLVSAILCEALHADYWKPIQAGLPRDSETVKNLLTNKQTIIHPERHLLQTPASPHAAAKIDNVSIKLNDFQLPKTQNNLIIEGAGGCLVPINDTHFVVDLISRLNIDVILVADLYLGSINHTLLTVEALKHRSLRIRGIIFNGQSNPESERIILAHTKIP